MRPGDADQSHPFPCQRFTDFPALSIEFQLALRSQLFDFRVLWIAPLRRMRVVAARARNPTGGGGLHAQRLMGANLVVLVAELVQPLLLHLGLPQAPATRHLQREMEAFDLALSLGAPNAAKKTFDALLHQPDL
jgi:hypothetical protein